MSAGPTRCNGLSFLARLTPYFDQTTIYNQLNFSIEPVWLDSVGYGPISARPGLPMLNCPSSPNRAIPWVATTSYAASVGNTVNWCADPNWFEGQQGGGNAAYVCGSGGLAVVYGNSRIRVGDVTDGTSNTMILSEITPGFPYMQQNNDYASCLAGTAPVATSHCWNGTAFVACPTAVKYEPVGYNWLYANGMQSWSFTTLLKPNDPIYKLQGNQWCNQSPWVGPAQFGSRSDHVGGVQILLADGAVRFVSENINLDTWRNLSLRADGSVIGEF